VGLARNATRRRAPLHIELFDLRGVPKECQTSAEQIFLFVRLQAFPGSPTLALDEAIAVIPARLASTRLQEML